MRIDADSIFSAAPSPYVLLDRELRIRWANDAYLRVTGRTRDSLIGKRINEEFPADPDSVSDTMLRESFARVLRTGEIDHLALIPYPIRGADGEMEDRYWSATHAPILDESGEVAFILQNTHDVTEQYRKGVLNPDDDPSARVFVDVFRRAEEVAEQNLTLGATADFLRSIFDQSPSFMAVYEGRDFVVRAANRAFLSLVPNRQLMGNSIRKMFPELGAQGYFEMLEGVMETGNAVRQDGAPVWFTDIDTGERTEIFVDFVFQPFRNDDGKITGVFIQGYDVTAQKLAEAEFRASADRFQKMAQAIPNHLWTAGPDGALDWVNDQVYAYTGMPEHSLYGEDWIKVLHPDDLEDVVAVWKKSIETGQGYETEFRIRAADGSYRWHLVRASAIRDHDGRIVSWLGSNTDIEDRKAVEAEIARLNATLESRVEERNRELVEVHATLRQSQKMEAIGNLAGGIAHDFNNLLQTITGSLELALREAPPESPLRQRLSQAMRAVDRGAKLSSQLLSFGRRQPLAPKSVDLLRLMTESEHIFRSAIGDGVELEIKAADDLWTTFVDPTNVENTLLNLALNAHDAMNGDGRLAIEFTNARLDETDCRDTPDLSPGDYVKLSVTDTGSGMTPEVLQKVFDPFFTTKPSGKGTGLGMSMVYGFVKQSGGHIQIESTPGEGTTISILLPRSDSTEADPSPRPSGPYSGGAETILLVEDDDDVRLVAANLLMDLGYTVIQARDPDVAMGIVDSGVAVDLLFTDVVMPGRLTSRELAERTRKRLPDVAVLFTSGYTQDSIVHHGRLDDDVELLSKPYSQEVLAQKVRSVLARRDARMQTAQAEQDTAAEAKAARDTSRSAAPAGSDGLQGLRVLVCEDEALIRLGMVDALESAGCTVSEAGNGGEALQRLETNGIDLLLTDLGLPDMSGMDLARRAVSAAPDLAVIFASGSLLDDDDAQGLPRAASLSKPFTDDMLLNAVRDVISR